MDRNTANLLALDVAVKILGGLDSDNVAIQDKNADEILKQYMARQTYCGFLQSLCAF